MVTVDPAAVKPGSLDVAARIAQVQVELGTRHPLRLPPGDRTNEVYAAWLDRRAQLEDARRACLGGRLEAAEALIAEAGRGL